MAVNRSELLAGVLFVVMLFASLLLGDRMASTLWSAKALGCWNWKVPCLFVSVHLISGWMVLSPGADVHSCSL